MSWLETELAAVGLDVEMDGPSVVAIGGGHGLAQCLRAAIGYAGSITAIVTVADDGGSSGRLAPALEIPPPGDIRQCLLALAPEESRIHQLFDHRFESGDVAGHSLGNLILAALTELEGDFVGALRVAGSMLEAMGTVIPASTRRLGLEAVVDGVKITGQVAIARSRGTVEALSVTPVDVDVPDAALDAIAAADQIVLGPGSLYTSVMAAMVVPGITEAINRSDATLVYVANLITQDGETLGMDVADHLEALLTLTGVRPPSAIVANAAPIEVAPPLEALRIDREAVETYGVDVVAADLRDPLSDWPRHDPIRLGEVLAGLHASGGGQLSS